MQLPIYFPSPTIPYQPKIQPFRGVWKRSSFLRPILAAILSNRCKNQPPESAVPLVPIDIDIITTIGGIIIDENTVMVVTTAAAVVVDRGHQVEVMGDLDPGKIAATVGIIIITTAHGRRPTIDIGVGALVSETIGIDEIQRVDDADPPDRIDDPIEIFQNPGRESPPKAVAVGILVDDIDVLLAAVVEVGIVRLRELIPPAT